MSIRTGTPVRDALEGAIFAISAAGCETPRLDAEVMLAHVLGVTRERLFLDSELEVEGEAVHSFREAVRRRAIEREPVAYITGRKGFRRIELDIDRRVLIPRPETELLVEAALGLPQGASMLDLGTGSGAIALAVKHERPDLQVWGSDVSEEAVAVASANAQRLDLDVHWLRSDLLREVPEEIDALVSNPPYVATADAATLAPEIARHEPEQALFAGHDGLSCITELLEQLGGRTRVRWLALEIGAGQADSVEQLMAQAGFSHVQRLPDLAGIERVVVAQR
ncbi:MAG TPA: peptide chain release factor N(5)-glutamine methyltransferase [Solirubrobacteraceae bacterium]|jgi:release factor glutamine methyltransferase|nr:peptide chain release factor N(5)-glutamine methyltransferase [Solirubrobacteraceae bacterium]